MSGLCGNIDLISVKGNVFSTREFLNNNDTSTGGYYIDLEGLNTIQFGGDLSIEMAIQNHDRTFKALYFSSVGEADGVNQASINARFNGLQNKN